MLHPVAQEPVKDRKSCARNGRFEVKEYPERMAKQEEKAIPDGTEKDFRDLLDFACTTTATPVSPREPKGKPETSSAPKAE
jgi:hypothetical protein